MNKDRDLKNNAAYDSRQLKARIADMLKGVRDAADEVKNAPAKCMPVIPVTGSRSLKYLNNKSYREF